MNWEPEEATLYGSFSSSSFGTVCYRAGYIVQRRKHDAIDATPISAFAPTTKKK